MDSPQNFWDYSLKSTDQNVRNMFHNTRDLLIIRKEGGHVKALGFASCFININVHVKCKMYFITEIISYYLEGFTLWIWIGHKRML